MKICFYLAWMDSTRINRKAFKLSENHALFTEYLKRISRFVACEVKGAGDLNHAKTKARTLWICDRGPGATMMSSEALAGAFKRLLDSGTKELHIAIGGPDGFSTEDIKKWTPDLRWSFGPLTLPHELAAVVAGEQIYRVLTILHHLPYHAGH
ncbi:MAG TPA: 23S rRNA (pseudouridine(1915)-N(3))-methyltransferase RlmH [bacterium]|nr:23S rRNA (pseudouridine(1915)-N(3))-methyltransferase RlmH [bacterium]